MHIMCKYVCVCVCVVVCVWVGGQVCVGVYVGVYVGGWVGVGVRMCGGEVTVCSTPIQCMCIHYTRPYALPTRVV